ncbi:MAG: site-2 protease family protein [Chloroflexota bacterium]
MTAIIAAVIVFSVLVLAHELGHFVTAKLARVRVEEFGLGYPPRVFGVKIGETTYSLNALPFGGFTKMSGEEDPRVLGSLAGKSILTRIIVLGAGSFMNAILPLFLFSLAFMIPHDVVAGEVLVEAVTPSSPAAVSGIEAGDTLLEFAGRPVANSGELQPLIQTRLGEKTSLLIRKSDGSTRMVRLTPRWEPPAGEGAMGVKLRTINYTTVRKTYAPLQAISKGATEYIDTYLLLKNGIIRIIIGSAPLQFGGPVAITQITAEVAQLGISPLLEFAAIISINLAIFNLLPIPALDGGRILFVMIEWLRRGKRISAKTEGLVHLIGFVSLLFFALIITLTDILRIINGGSLIP